MRFQQMVTVLGGGPQIGRASFFSLGCTLIGLGLLLVWKPELLAYLIAGFMIVSGVVFLGFGWTLRRVERNSFSRSPFES